MTASASLVPSTPLPSARRTTFDTAGATPSFSGAHYSTNRRHSLSVLHCPLLPTYMHSYRSRYGTEDRIVLDPGCRTWRVGFSGEGRPRDVFQAQKPVSFTEPKEKDRTSLWDLDMGSAVDDREEGERALYERLKDRLRRTFIQSLMVDPKGRKIIVAENPMLPVCIKEMMARILFKNLQVPSVSFAPSGLLALLASGRTTGLVVDIGHLETTILPIYQARPMYPKLRSTPLGGARLSSHLRDLLLLFGGYYAPPDLRAPPSAALPGLGSVPEDVLTDDVLEDIKVRCCYVEDPLPTRRRRREVPEPALEGDELDISMLDAPPPDTATSSATASPHISETHPTPLHALRAHYSAHTTCTDIQYTLKNRGVLSIPGWVRSRAAELFFAPGDVDEASLSELILRCLASLNADLRKVFVDRILVIGGTAGMRGLIARLELELEKMVNEPVPSQNGFPRHPDWTKDPWETVRHLKGKFRAVNNPQRPTGEGRAPGWSPGSMVWVGGSLAGALKLSGEEISRERYDEAEKAARRAAVLAESGATEEDDELDEDVDIDVDEDESDAWKRGFRLPDWTRVPLPQGAPMAPRRVVAAA
ncbi:actin-like ATPase domain-containing protein [Calocera cornea HHB12733]|uniref:Actin-like ATPase domain-containing protein n=1 Tax=Calocera cornea HHB12733 TaxID=1353952 RepID=A0A165G6A8_9BASI|nr:actin-like ATPase domain-containing protein [Calocera cornea HHB12733]